MFKLKLLNGEFLYAEKRMWFHDTPALDVDIYRWRDDDGSETAATWLEIASTAHDFDVGAGNVQARLRVNISESGGANAPNQTMALQVSINGGAFNTITASTTGVIFFDSTNLTNNTDVTEQLNGGGTFQTSNLGQCEDGIANATLIASNNDREIEYTVEFVAADLNDGDTVTFQIGGGTTGVITATVTPTATITKGAASQTITDMDFISSTVATYIPTVITDSIIALGFIAATSALFTPTVESTTQFVSDTDFIASTATMYEPSVDFDATQIIADTDFIASTSVLKEPSLNYTAAIPVLQSFNTGTAVASSLTLNKPAGVAVGDLLVIFVSSDNDTDTQDFEALTDWTLHNVAGSSFTDVHIAAYYKIADGTEGASETITTTTTWDMSGFYLRITGAEIINTIDNTVPSRLFGSTSRPLLGAITALSDNCLGLYYMGSDDGRCYPYTLWSGDDWVQSGQVQVDNILDTTASVFGHANLVSSGASDPVTVDCSIGNGQAGMLLTIAQLTSQIIDLDSIAATSTTYLPTVTGAAGSQTINDTDFISAASVTYEPTLVPGSWTITDTDFISAGSALYTPSVNLGTGQNISNTFISATSVLYEPDVGATPVFISSVFSTRIEGDLVTWDHANIRFDEGSAPCTYANLKELPDGLVFDDSETEGQGYVTYIGTLSYSSGGLPIIQASATNQFGSKTTNNFAWRIHNAIPLDFISGGSALYEPTIAGTWTITDVDFVTSTVTLYEPTVTSGATVISDTDFISSGHTVYEPDIGIAPKFIQNVITSPRFEGDVVPWDECYSGWASPIDSIAASVGDTPPDLVVGNLGTYVANLSGTLAADSAGTYSIQWSVTNDYGTTLSTPFDYVVQKKLSSDFISSGNVLYEPTFTGTITLSNTFIASGNVLYEPTFTGTWTISDVDFIASGNVLYTPDVNALVAGQIDCDFIISGSTLYEPTFISSLVIADTDFISSGSVTYLPAIGKKPRVSSADVQTPRVEGQAVLQSHIFVSWSDANFLSNEGDIPDGLSFGTLAAAISHLSGVLSDVSAGTYSIQHSATNSFGTTLSEVYPLVVKERIQVDFISSTVTMYEPTIGGANDVLAGFISSTETVYEPTLTGSYTITDTDFITSTILLYEPTLTGTLTITDVDFIASTLAMYEPLVYDGTLVQNYEVVEFQVKISRTHSDEYNVAKTVSDSYKITKEVE